jgi:PPOX class probable F420-dependent enzyme
MAGASAAVYAARVTGLLDGWALELLAEARRAVLTTIDLDDGRPRSVPICFALSGDALWSPIDEKPKASADLRRLRRIRNLAADPRATILVDLWSETWTQLAFLELRTLGGLVESGAPGHATAVAALRARYPQYAAHRLESRPMLRFEVIGTTGWNAASEVPGPSRQARTSCRMKSA